LDGIFYCPASGSACTEGIGELESNKQIHLYRGSIAVTVDSLIGYQSNHNAVIDRFTLDGGWDIGAYQHISSNTASRTDWREISVVLPDARLAANHPASLNTLVQDWLRRG
jgi:hypothetical protein